MSDSLDQIQLNFVPNEDRLLLKLRGGDKLYRAWVTRRYLKLLLPVLQGVHPTTGERFAEPPAVEAALDQQLTPEKQPPLEQSADSSPLVYPLGKAPILLTEAQYDTPGKRLILKPARGQGIVLPYTPEVNHMLLKLIYQVLPSTQWALEEEILSPMPQALQ